MTTSKQPPFLFQLCVKQCATQIYTSLNYIEKMELHERKKMAQELKSYLMSRVPDKLFNVFGAQRVKFRSDPRIHLYVLTHPNIAIFQTCYLDHSIPDTWLDGLSQLRYLVSLDIGSFCSDEILEIICQTCHLLEELNIATREDKWKTRHHALAPVRKVSDAGLLFIYNLKKLKYLSMDPPSTPLEIENRVGRLVSQGAVLNLIRELPCLEELRMKSCDIGSMLTATTMDIGPLNLRKMQYNLATADGMKKLIKICPVLRDLSITYLSEQNKDLILDEIFKSELRLDKLELRYFANQFLDRNIVKNQREISY